MHHAHSAKPTYQLINIIGNQWYGTYLKGGKILRCHQSGQINQLHTRHLQTDIKYQGVELCIILLCIPSALAVNQKNCNLKYVSKSTQCVEHFQVAAKHLDILTPKRRLLLTPYIIMPNNKGFHFYL